MKIKHKLVKLKSLVNLREKTLEKTKTIFSHTFKSKIFSKEILFNNIKNRFNSISKVYILKPKLLIQELQDVIEKFSTEESYQVFLKQPKFWASSITWVLIGTSTFAIGWLAIAKTDEIVIASGKLEPKGGVIEVQMPLEGIAKEILIIEGEIVKKGQVLIRLDTEITEAENKSLLSSLELNQTIENKLEKLVSEGAVPEIQYLQQKEKIAQLKSRIVANKVQLKYQEIVAPIGGKVFELQPKGPGYVAKSSQPVLKIVPAKNLIAKIEIPSRTIGFVQTGQKAEISVDSFPATDFGVIQGEITKIGSDALLPNPQQGLGYRFPADIRLDNQFLKIKNGKKLTLKAGMSLTANIKLRKATFLQILFNKFGDKAQSLRSL